MNRVCSSVQKCVLPLGLFVCLFVCLFLPGRCVYKLHYSNVKDQRQEKRMHIHTHTRAHTHTHTHTHTQNMASSQGTSRHSSDAGSVCAEWIRSLRWLP